LAIVFLNFFFVSVRSGNQRRCRPNPSPPVCSLHEELVKSIARGLLLSHVLSILLVWVNFSFVAAAFKLLSSDR
jgi:hypothetical protein